MLKARQRTQARFESFLQDAVAEDRCEFFFSTGAIIIIIFITGVTKFEAEGVSIQQAHLKRKQNPF